MAGAKNRVECDTIFALASGRGRAGVAVVRVSGPECGVVTRTLTGRPSPEPRRAVLRTIRDPRTGAPLDRGLVLYFAAPHSFTGEEVVEFHVHGGRAVLDAVVEALGACAGLRPAEAGEFSRRAFDNGRLDLTEAEGLDDLIRAETAAQRAQALRQMSGAFGALCEDWRGRLIEASALVEAAIDFSDEDLPEGVAEQAVPKLAALRGEIAGHLEDAGRGERLRAGASVVLLGAPNVGKSSLLNALARRDAAIVSETAGTTRDVIEVVMDLGGYPVTLVDTAGIREAGDAIEAEGVRRALDRAAVADLSLVLVDAAAWPDLPDDAADLRGAAGLLVLNKADQRDDLAPGRVGDAPDIFAVSATTGAGLGALLGEIEARIVALCDTGDAPAITRQRHRAALEACVAALDRFAAVAPRDPVLAAEDARLAARALGRITGRVDVEDILDVVFSRFCIGK